LQVDQVNSRNPSKEREQSAVVRTSKILYANSPQKQQIQDSESKQRLNLRDHKNSVSSKASPQIASKEAGINGRKYSTNRQLAVGQKRIEIENMSPTSLENENHASAMFQIDGNDTDKRLARRMSQPRIQPEKPKPKKPAKQIVQEVKNFDRKAQFAK
jgi:hypothetical protein